MGGGMAKRLLGMGWPVHVHDKDAATQQALQALGAQGCDSPAAVAQAADTVIVCVIDAVQVQEVLDGPDGLLARMKPGQTVIMCPTMAPADTEDFARQLQTAVKQEIAALPKLPADAVLSAAKRWMHRDEVQVPVQFHALLKQARDALPNVDTMVRMREELRQMWLNTNASRAQLALDLQQWCLRAEQSGVVALRDFSVQLRAARI